MEKEKMHKDSKREDGLVKIKTACGTFYTNDDDLTMDEHLALINGPIASAIPILNEELNNVLEIKENNMEKKESRCCKSNEGTSEGTCCKTRRRSSYPNKHYYSASHRDKTDRLAVLLDYHLQLQFAESGDVENEVAKKVEGSILELLDNKISL